VRTCTSAFFASAASTSRHASDCAEDEMKSEATMSTMMMRLRRISWRGAAAGALAAASLSAGVVALPAGGAGATRHARHHFTVGVSLYTNSIPYIQMRQGMEHEAKILGVTLDFSYSDFSGAEQALQISEFVTKRVNVILCAPVSISLLVPAFRKARNAGVPIISVANDLPPEDETGFIGRAWSLMGTDQMTFVEKELHGTGQVAEVAGPSTLEFVQGEKQGWTGVLSKAKGLHLVATDTDPTVTESAAFVLADEILTAHPNVKAIVGSTDTIAEGIAEALQRHGVKPGAVIVTGLYATPAVVTSIRHHGYIQFTISMKAFTWGVQAIELADEWLTGNKPKNHTVATAYQIVTPSNATKLAARELL
jgi:ABC-type sugar transport system substrate-binding protein